MAFGHCGKFLQHFISIQFKKSWFQLIWVKIQKCIIIDELRCGSGWTNFTYPIMTQMKGQLCLGYFWLSFDISHIVPLANFPFQKPIYAIVPSSFSRLCCRWTSQQFETYFSVFSWPNDLGRISSTLKLIFRFYLHNSFVCF